MKKAVIIVLLLVASVCMSQAGEKEELEWQVKYWQERVERFTPAAQAYMQAMTEYKKASGKLKALEDLDKKPKKEVKKDER